MKLDKYECDGQMSLFEVSDKPLKFHEAEWLEGHGFKNVYDEPPKAGIYEFTDIEYPTKVKKFEVTESGAIKLGSSDFVARWWRPIAEDKVCSFSGHTCNKKNLWEVADTLDNIKCPHVCCRNCDVKMCGARCNGSEEPKKQKDRKQELDEKYAIPRKHQKEEGWTDDWHYSELELPKEAGIYYCIHYGYNADFYMYTYMAWAFGHWWAYAGYGDKWLLVKERRDWLKPFAWVTVPDLYYRTDPHHQFLCEHFVTEDDWKYEQRIEKLGEYRKT